MKAVLGCVAVVLIALGLRAFWFEPASLRVVDSIVALPTWSEACDGLRVAVLADLHVGSPFNDLKKLEAIVARTQAAAPDLVLLAGDYVIQGVMGGTFVPPEEAARVLGRLQAPAGVFAVLGNHDWWLDAVRVRSALEAASIPVLEDQARFIETKRCRFWLAGVSDLWEGRHDIEAALRPVPADAPTILFTHNPDLFPEVPERVALTIAGHTHGGQVYLPGIGRPIVPSSFGERFAMGHVVEGGRHLFVSPGTGTSILPVRFLVPPEISMLTLRAVP